MSAIRSLVPAGGDAGPTSGLQFPLNYTANSVIRMGWGGAFTASVLSRTSHTIIRKVCWIQQAGYYAWGWFSRNTLNGVFDSNWVWNGHPYPSDTGAVDGTGASIAGTGGSGEIHYHEIASLGAKDWLASPGGSAVLVVKGTPAAPVWYTQALI